MALKTSDILAALGTATLAGPTGTRTFERVVIDSRDDCSRGLFVALRGERFDGNRFLDQAAESGAVGALVGPPEAVGGMPEGLQCFIVEDTLKSLQSLAAWWREVRTGCRVVGVTGSNGKSTTKQMIAAVLGRAFRTQATAGNLNNHIGLPLTLLSLKSDTECLVAEMGANHPGEIRLLARLARPGISVVTNIAPCHLEGFGSLRGVLDAKLELFEETAGDGVLIYNGDDPLLAEEVPKRFVGIRSFGLGEHCDIRATEILLDSRAGASFTLDRSIRVNLAIPGRHNVLNALAAVAVGMESGVPPAEIKLGLETTEPMGLRMQLQQTGNVKILNDSYNANPSSMREALNTLEQISHSGRRLAVLGEMLELGEDAADLHRMVAREAAGKGLDLVVFVGRFADLMKKEFTLAGGDPRKALVASDSAGAWEALKPELRPEDLLLLKASRGIRLETIAREMEKEAG